MAAANDKTDAAAPTDETEVIRMFRPNSPTFKRETVELLQAAHRSGVFSSADHAEAAENNELSLSDAVGAVATILNRLDVFNKLQQDPEAEVFPAHKEAAAWAVENGISDGTRPTLPATRQQVWQMQFNHDKALKDQQGGK